MGAAGTFLGALFAVSGLSLSLWMTFSITTTFLPLLWFAAFGIIGGLGLGALNTRKAKKQNKYKNEYMLYGFGGFIAILALLVYYLFINPDALVGKVVAENTLGLDEQMTIVTAAVGGILLELGVGLSFANMIAE